MASAAVATQAVDQVCGQLAGTEGSRKDVEGEDNGFSAADDQACEVPWLIDWRTTRPVLNTRHSRFSSTSIGSPFTRPPNPRDNFRAGADPDDDPCPDAGPSDNQTSSLTRQEMAASLKQIGKTWERVLNNMCTEESTPKPGGKEWDEKIETSVTLTRKVPMGGKGDLAGLDELIEPLLAGGRAVQFMMRHTSKLPGNNPLRGMQTRITEVDCFQRPKKMTREFARLRVLKTLKPCLYKTGLAWLGQKDKDKAQSTAAENEIATFLGEQGRLVVDRKASIVESDINRMKRAMCMAEFHLVKTDQMICDVQEKIDEFIESSEHQDVLRLKRCIMERICRYKAKIAQTIAKREELRYRIEKLKGEEERVRSKVSIEYPPTTGMSLRDVQELQQYQLLGFERKKTQVSGFEKMFDKIRRDAREDIRTLRSLWSRNGEVDASARAMVQLIEESDPCGIVMKTLYKCLNLPSNYPPHCLVQKIKREVKEVVQAAEGFGEKFS